MNLGIWRSEAEGLVKKGIVSLDVVKISRRFSCGVKRVMVQDGLEVKSLTFAIDLLRSTAFGTQT